MVWAVACSLWPALGYTTGPKMERLEKSTRVDQRRGVSENAAHPKKSNFDSADHGQSLDLGGFP